MKRIAILAARRGGGAAPRRGLPRVAARAEGGAQPAKVPDWPRPQLEIRDLELVLALAAAGSTAGAAAALHITQSAVSRALQQAEDRLGVRLFDRSARGLVATVAGRRLIDGAAPVLAGLRELEQSVGAPALPPERVRIVCQCYTAYRWVPSALVQLRGRLPGLELEIAIEHTGDPVAALVAGEIDIALLTTGEVPARSSLQTRPLFSDEIVFVMSASHPLAKNRSLTRDDLRAHPLITSNTPPAEARWFVNSVFGRHKPKLEFLRFPLTEAIIDAARAGMGIAVLSEWMASGYLERGDLVMKRLSGGPLRRPWRMAYRSEATVIGERLAAALSSSMPRLYLAPA